MKSTGARSSMCAYALMGILGEGGVGYREGSYREWDCGMGEGTSEAAGGCGAGDSGVLTSGWTI